MTDIGLAEYLGMGEAIGIIGTLFVIMYFSNKQIQSLSGDIETKIVNDLAQRMHALHKIALERPQLIKVLNKADADSPELAYMYDILFTFAHFFHMRQRKVLSDNEWTGWLRRLKSSFQQGEIMQIWQSTIEMEKRFNPAFQRFVNKELIPRTPN